MGKYKFDRKRVVKTIIYGILSLVTFVGQLYIKNRSDYEEIRYYRQGLIILMAVFLLLFVIQLRNLLPRKLKRDLRAKILHWIDYIFLRPLRWLIRFLRKIFGLPEYKDSKKKDERSFVFDFEGSNIIKRIMSIGNKQRWRDMESNAQKIRYLYIKYVVKLTKSGFKFNPARTPDELVVDYKLKNDPKKLFRLYVGARYSNGSYRITDEDVEMATKLINKKGKIS